MDDNELKDRQDWRWFWGVTVFFGLCTIITCVALLLAFDKADIVATLLTFIAGAAAGGIGGGWIIFRRIPERRP